MLRVVLAICLIAAVVATSATDARPDAAELTKRQAIAAVRGLLREKAAPCGYRIIAITARRAGQTWRVAAVTAGKARGTSLWTVGNRTPKPLNALARTIRSGCPKAPTRTPSPPPTPPLPTPGPGAAATYVFGPELSVTEQALVREGLDAGARYYRATLGRELPPFTVWAYEDLEALIRVYAESRPTSLEDARRLWEGGQVGHATPGKVWLGPSWFANAPSSALKIAAHEAFHLFQYQIVGERPLGVSGLDEIPTAGPWWLIEGVAEYFAYLAVDDSGALRISNARAQWVGSTKASAATTLRALSTLRGQRETRGAYDIYALATELLLRGRDPKLGLAYFESVAHGTSWPDAFVATFGRTIDAFVDEFEAYRRTL